MRHSLVALVALGLAGCGIAPQVGAWATDAVRTASVMLTVPFDPAPPAVPSTPTTTTPAPR